MEKGTQEGAVQPADEEITGRILAGEPQLYELIMRRYNARLYRIGMGIVKNDTEVEDLMQVAYIKAYEHLNTFQQRSGFGTWLTRIFINECLHHLKKKKQDMTVMINEDAMHSSGNSPAGSLLNKELSRVLEHSLEQLPDKYRIVFVLREMEHMSVAETTTMLNITEANVKVRLNRAKAMLRDSLGSYYKHDGIYHFHLHRCDRIVHKVLQKLGI